MTFSAMASLLLGQAAWPLFASEAEGLVQRFFLGRCSTVEGKRTLLRKLELPGPAFPVWQARAYAELHAQAALAELLILGLITSSVVGREIDVAYIKTKLGTTETMNLTLSNFTSRLMCIEGWI